MKWTVRRPGWVEVHLDRVARNARRFQKILGPSRLAAVVKADAYGHGLERIARRLYRAGVRWYCVSTAEEAHRLRDTLAGIRILMMGPADLRDVPGLVKRDITLTLYSIDLARHLHALARRQRKKFKVHLKIDTGMNRLGVPWRSAGEFITRMKLFDGVELEGVFSHLATALENRQFMTVQKRRYDMALKLMAAEGFTPKIRHLANTGGVLAGKSFHYDMARVGIGLYGVTPVPLHASRLKLEEALAVMGRVVSIKWVAPGDGVGYGLSYLARKLTPVAVMPIGYADGMMWNLGGRGFAVWHGVKLPVLGRVCMDQTFLDISRANERLSVGEEVLILGAHDVHGRVGLWETAKLAGTIPYEIMTAYGRRLPRIYVR